VGVDHQRLGIAESGPVETRRHGLVGRFEEHVLHRRERGGGLVPGPGARGEGRPSLGKGKVRVVDDGKGPQPLQDALHLGIGRKLRGNVAHDDDG
jgi:hypothetical protein